MTSNQSILSFGCVDVQVVFSSPEVCRSDVCLRFEAVGGTKDFGLPVIATAAVPTINTDPVRPSLMLDCLMR